jgi:hypothetical protein
MVASVFARPTGKELEVQASTTSIATTPVAGAAVAPVGGFIQRVMAAPGGTTTGTISIAVSVNNGSDITGGNLTIAAGSNARAGSVFEFPTIGTTNPAVQVFEGDIITFTPSGGTGSSIAGAFGAVIRKSGG